MCPVTLKVWPVKMDHCRGVWTTKSSFIVLVSVHTFCFIRELLSMRELVIIGNLYSVCIYAVVISVYTWQLAGTRKIHHYTLRMKQFSLQKYAKFQTFHHFILKRNRHFHDLQLEQPEFKDCLVKNRLELLYCVYDISGMCRDSIVTSIFSGVFILDSINFTWDWIFVGECLGCCSIKTIANNSIPMFTY